MAAKPSVAIVGAGWMGETHLRCYLDQGVEVLGLVDPDTDRARILGERYGVAEVFSTFTDLIARYRPTGVSITSPENHHADDAVLALKNHIGVLVEKPLADNLADGLSIVSAARRSGAVLIPAHVLRFAGPYRALHEQVTRGELGRIVGITARRDRTQATGARYSHVHPAYLTMVHDIDQVIWMTGSRFVRIRAFEHRPNPESQANLVLVQATMASGVLVSLVSGTLHPSEAEGSVSDRLEVYGTEGVAYVDLSHPPVVVHGRNAHVPDWILDPTDMTGAFCLEIAHFVERLVAGTPSDLVSPDDAIAGLMAIDGIMRSIKGDGCDVWLDEDIANADS